MRSADALRSKLPFPYYTENPNWSNVTIRLIAQIANEGGDFGEIERAMKDVHVGNNDEWHRNWTDMARYIEEKGSHAISENHSVSAWKYLFRAANYYRQAQQVLDSKDARKVPTYLKTVECFSRASRYHYPLIEPVEIPYEGVTMNGYIFHRFGDSKQSGPGLVWFGGADSPAEETYFQGGVEAIRRGLTVLAVNGPGQGLSLYARGLHGRPDYEKPFSAAIDFFQQKSGVDPERIGIMGNSLGGYYSVRAAAFEKRAKACVAYDVAYDVTEDLYDFFPPIKPTMQWIVGASDDAEARQKLKLYTLKDVCPKVTCPVLLVHGEQDYIMRPSAVSKVRNELSSASVDVRMYVGTHSIREYYKEVMSQIFDWVLDNLG
ncbi:MAG: prolyl oligopeptidase family serine peptidase [Nitrososphaerota archaeon]|nr:prolyl oligopeptidase family serine peptidase [Nitrososphaerota archaeon]MDG6924234.1 prolyl oligopeptidase family serine peptidase [Nitrososphaerota archaeon]